MADLRSRRHAQTRSDIVDAALALFTERGMAEVTMEEIAAEAGVSRSTAYRRFPTKDDIVLSLPRRWLDAFDEAVALARDEGIGGAGGVGDGDETRTSLADLVLAGSLAVAGVIDDDRERVLAAFAILETAPALQASGVANEAWITRFAALAERHGFEPWEAVVVGGAYMGAINAMMFEWSAGGGNASVVDQTRAVHRRLLPLFD